MGDTPSRKKSSGRREPFDWRKAAYKNRPPGEKPTPATPEAKAEGRRKGLTKMAENTFRRISNDGRQIAEFVMNDPLLSVKQAAQMAFPDDRDRQKAARAELRRSPSATEIMWNGQRLQMIPVTVLLLKAQAWLEKILDKQPLCEECGGNLNIDLKHVLSASRQVLDALKEAGALSLTAKALEQDRGTEKSIEEVAREYLRDLPKALETEEANRAEPS